MFEQSNLVNNLRSFTYKCKRGKVQHLHLQIVFMSYFYNPVYERTTTVVVVVTVVGVVVVVVVVVVVGNLR